MTNTKDYQIKQLRLQHAKILLDIFNDLEEWKKWYLEFTKFYLGFNYSEFIVLINGLGDCINSVDYNYPVIGEKYLTSLIKSFEMFEARYLCSISEKNYAFVTLLELSLQKLKLMKSEIFEV